MHTQAPHCMCGVGARFPGAEILPGKRLPPSPWAGKCFAVRRSRLSQIWDSVKVFFLMRLMKFQSDYFLHSINVSRSAKEENVSTILPL